MAIACSSGLALHVRGPHATRGGSPASADKEWDDTRILPRPVVPAALGALLKEARQRRGLSLEMVARETKIPRRHLESLEHGDLSAVPGGIYLRAEVRSYARAVGLDEGIALAQLDLALIPPVEHEPAGDVVPQANVELHGKGRPHPPLRAWLWLLTHALAIAIAAAVAAMLWRVATRRTPAAEPAAVAKVAHVESDPSRNAADQAPTGQRLPSAPRASSVTTTLPQPAPRETASQTELAVPPGAGHDDGSRTAVTVLIVMTDPPGARVTVDGIGWGTSPTTIRHLPPGIKRIRATLDGHLSDERSVSLAVGRPQRVRIPLRTVPDGERSTTP